MEDIMEDVKKGMDSEDLENCDEYQLPDWWDNDSVELKPIKKEPTTKLKDIIRKKVLDK
jgi:hypothetical protein